MESTNQYLSVNDVKYHLANTPQITFEVTDACNLKCTYCGYGRFYSDYDTRENKRLSVDKAIVLLEYLHQLCPPPSNYETVIGKSNLCHVQL